MQGNLKPISKILLTASFAGLIGCAAVQTALEHRSLEVSTRQSQTIFLDPVSNKEKTIYVAVKNTSDQEIDINPQLKQALSAQGYLVLVNPNQAHYLLQANILKVGKMSQAASRAALTGGYGSALAGAVAGTAVGALSGNTNAMIGGGLIGGALGLAADSLVKDVNYTMITDAQVSEKLNRKVREDFNANLKNGSASNLAQSYSKETNYQRYRTRIVSNADQVNLKFTKARPMLEQGLVKALAGIF